MEQTTGWAGLFNAAFTSSRNAMALVDARRHILDVNAACLRLTGYRRGDVLGRPLWEFVDGGPLMTPQEWEDGLALRYFSGEAKIVTADDSLIAIHWGATTEQFTGHRRVLLVAIRTSRWGERFRRDVTGEAAPSQSASGPLSAREKEIVNLVALGMTGPEIADELSISHDTVRTHVRNSMVKLNARSRAHLVAKAIGEGHSIP
jgi:DNA-binding CsgD family transcriptional regulator